MKTNLRHKHPRSFFVCLLVATSLFALPIDGDLPSADEVIARAAEAAGGEKKIRATTSMRSTGTMDMAGMTAEVEIAARAPNLYAMKVNMANVGEVTMGFDGEVAWTDNPMTGPMILDGDQALQMIQDADFYKELNYQDRFPTRETVAKVDFAGQDSYKVRLVDQNGKELHQFFSVDSGLLVGFEGEQINDMGKVFVTTELSDYREIEGRKVPMTTTAKMMGMEVKVALDQVTFNDVEGAVFELPATIQALAEKD